MWDSNSPLQLLNTMPRKLTKENLERLQLVIDADKYKNSLVSGFDLCGMYAPFCRGCKKTSIYPCAVAYVNMMKSGGMDIEIDAKPIEAGEPHTASAAETTKEIIKETEDEVAVTKEDFADNTAEAKDVPVKPAEQRHETYEAPAPVRESVKRKIRIAVARRKI